MSGYDIKKQVNAALAIVTNASYGMLYPTLHRLLAAEAVHRHMISWTGRPAKQVYQITNGAAGISGLAEASGVI
ncbi:MAG: PadR family transcriptional regulator [Chloroflexi bacterium]|nr:PadR family transcriptional regulator [Chloroflexota bacterium]